ncbi:MAG: hypothetical protein ACLTFJ_02940 [Clostridium sp.]
MERCDFSSVMTIVRRFISDDYDTNQTALLLEHGKVFLHGIAGIGKSELAKGSYRKY